MRRVLTRLVAILAPLAIVLAWPTPASAHPLGNFTVNRYSGIHVVPGEIRIDYVVDLAEVPTFQEMPAIDADEDGSATPNELASWAGAQVPGWLSNITLEVDGSPVDLEVRSSSARLRPGQGGLSTLRFEGVFAGPAPDAGALTYRDGNDPDRVGWREITAVGEDGRALSGSTVPARSVSDALLSYPQNLLQSPLHVTSMESSFAPGDVSAGGGTAPAPDAGSTAGAAADARPGIEGGPFAGLIENHGLGLMALGLVLAIAFGAWHAMLPGHGKTLMAAYVVGSDAKVRQAVAAGCAVAIMHTASVVALGLLVLTLQATFRPEALYPWLGLASGLVALALGAWLLIRRLAAWSHARSHAHGHDHAHAFGHAHGHDHADGLPEGGALSARGLLALALAGGILPAPSALIVMLAAINGQRTTFGLGLVLAFSAGLAVALVSIGLGAIRAREAVSRRMTSTWVRLVPVFSAAAIVAVGLFLTVRGVGGVARLG